MNNSQFYIFLTISIIALIGLIIIIIFQINTSKYIIGKKFKLKNYYEHQAITNVETIKLSIHNPNFIDARILGFGYSFDNRNIDYMSVYLNQQENKIEDAKVVIPSRDFIYAIIDQQSLIDTVNYYNHGIKKIRKMYMYVIDHQGETTKVNARLMKKLINTVFAEKRAELKMREHQITLEEKKQKSDLAKQNKMIRQEKRNEKKELSHKQWEMKHAKTEKEPTKEKTTPLN